MAAILNKFDVRGETIVDEETEELIRAGDPHRSLVRYRSDGREIFVNVRLNMRLLQAAISLPVLHLKPAPRPDELLQGAALLTVDGSIRNYRFLDSVVKAVAAAAMPACYLAEQHGDGRRDFYFITEDAAGFDRLVRAVAHDVSMSLVIENCDIAAVAGSILPREAVADLGLSIAADALIQPTRFEFWGSLGALTKLRTELERRGYRFLGLEAHLGELRMLKDVPIDAAFQGVISEIVALSRSLRCSYCGTETVLGANQFALDRPLSERYLRKPQAKAGIMSRIFGRGTA
jgi:hypothetical protein